MPGRSTMRVVFLTLFLDLMGFSIIFPLYPEMTSWYLANDPDDPLLGLVMGLVRLLPAGAGGGGDASVVFGGVLGALYSLLQFASAPVLGSLSDRVGRRPVLLASSVLLGLGHLLWFVGASFTTLLLSRAVTGIMGGNLSVATAAVADSTGGRDRAGGMAVVGVAFGLGMVLGPAMGGLLSTVRLDLLFPGSAALGVNPFSACAGVAVVLCAANALVLALAFSETLPPGARAAGSRGGGRSADVPGLLGLAGRGWPRGVLPANLAHGLFVLSFSGVEFTVAFLARDRFGFSPVEIGWLFVFVGTVLAGVQGGLVRRRAAQVGERRMALLGHALVLPGLLATAWAGSVPVLLAGSFLLAAGCAMVMPCLTALVSLYAGPGEQGRCIGAFRSLGSLARVVGPPAASLLYWGLGPSRPFLWGAALLAAPAAIVASLPAPRARAGVDGPGAGVGR